MDYFVIDVETAPVDTKKYSETLDEKKAEFLNPLDSKIVAIGLRYKNENKVFLDLKDEKKILEDFWAEWSSIKRGNPSFAVVGFNINAFDLPMLVGRSFIQNVSVSAFVLKEIIDLRQKLSVYAYKPRGKLKEYAELVGLDIGPENGSMVANWVEQGKTEVLSKYLKSDLEITDALFKRAENLNIIQINKW
ncbi:MAG: hypothetical protein ABIA93_07810 [Candidatus Woesearchaeota archaeon]